MNIAKDSQVRQSWRAAWADASHGPSGFWRDRTPRGQFRTGPSTSDVAARLIGAFCVRHCVAAVVDIGAGDGALLDALAAEFTTLDLYGVDLRDAPDGLATSVAWATDTWHVGATPDDASGWTTGEAEMLLATLDRPTLIVAHEWLDDLPCTITVDGYEATVGRDGAPESGSELDPTDRDWLQRWWPAATTTGEAEVGASRDTAWAAALSHLHTVGGYGLVVDYGHTHADRRPTLTGFRDGRQVAPVPDGTANLTAHVAIDAVAEAADRHGTRLLLARQREVLRDGLPDVPAPAPRPTDNPVTELAERSTRALTQHRQGDLWWLLHRVEARGTERVEARGAGLGHVR